jgi:Secretion system C-terminal sorting domain
MKKLYSLMLLLLTVSVLHAQRPTRVAPPGVANARMTYDQKFKQLVKDEANGPTKSAQVAPESANAVNKAAMAVTPTAIGRASNAFSILRAEQNQVYADPSLDLIAFIHRQDVSIFGGGGAANGKYRYDVSIDNGATWSIDNGVLNNLYTRPARYPNISGFNASGNTDPFASELVWVGPSLDPSPDWDGHVYGVSDVTTSGTTTSTEHYNFLAGSTLLPGGLCQGLPGEFWAVDFWYDGTNSADSLYIYKGVYASSDITFTRTAIAPNHSTSFDGTVTAVGPNIAFSPDGNDGWIAWLGDLNGGGDSCLLPIMIHSSDGGATWGTPMEVDLNATPFVADSLMTLWTDSLGTILSTGRATCAFDYDLIVDGQGNPHFTVVIGSGTTTDTPEPGYSIFSGLAKFLGDVTTTDGGATFDVTYVAPVLAFRGEFGTPDPTDGSLLTIDNYVQNARDASGDHIFFSWMDSDTTVVGFGESNNIAPNLRISSLRVSDGFQTCYKLITDGDIVWDGKALCPTLSPIVAEDINGYDYSMPIVMLEMITNDQLAPCQFSYFGSNCYFVEADYLNPSSLSLSWDGGCAVPYNPINIFTGVDEVVTPAVNMIAYPNPTSGITTVKFDLIKNAEVALTLVNVYGQTVVSLSEGNLVAGEHRVLFNTNDVAPGIYFLNLNAGSVVMTEKLVIVK